MAKQRFINTRFWSDPFIVKLDRDVRYLFLYFLTNEHTNIAGVYELALETVAFETKMTIQEITNALAKLTGKVEYVDGWVWIKNFQKHNSGNGNSRVITGIEHEMNSIPKEILAKIKELGSTKPKTDTPCIPYIYPMQGGHDLNLNSDLDLDSDLNPPTPLRGEEATEQKISVRGETPNQTKTLKAVPVPKREAEKSLAQPQDFLKNKNPQIQIIGLFAQAKNIQFENAAQSGAFIRRNLRAAQSLTGYSTDRIVSTMKYLIENADFKWTLETVGKFIDEPQTPKKSVLLNLDAV